MCASFRKPGEPRRLRTPRSAVTATAATNKRTEARPLVPPSAGSPVRAPERTSTPARLPAQPRVLYTAAPAQGVAMFNRGIPGPPGPSGGGQVFEFDTPSDTWVIEHGLDRLPGVTVYDTDGNIRPLVPVSNPSLGVTILTPNPPLAGKVVLT